MQSQLIHRRAFPLHRRDHDGVGVLHQPFNDVFEKGLHDKIKN
jgi:hypothetical protein